MPKIEPPRAWTNDFEILGGVRYWMPGGEMFHIMGSRGFDPMTIRPLYATEPWTGDHAVLFEADDPAEFFLFNRDGGSLRQILGMSRLEDIVEFLNDENNQFDHLSPVEMFDIISTVRM